MEQHFDESILINQRVDPSLDQGEIIKIKAHTIP